MTSRFRSTCAFAIVLAFSAPAHAQAPGRPPIAPPIAPPNGGEMRGPTNGPGGPEVGPPRLDAASMLLAHTGELKLTDAQVTRLAVVARRTADRRKERIREQEHADLRDALTVLTPDQLAQGWEMMASRGGRRGGPPPEIGPR